MQGLTKGREFVRVASVRVGAALILAGATTLSLASGVAITSSGTPTYSAALSVPPGIGGMTPSLTLNYTGGGPNGPLGYGWSLGGASLITRCPGSVFSSGRALPVAFTVQDRLCLDGQRLIESNSSGAPIAASPAANALLQDAAGHPEDGTSYTEYRTEKDSFARIRAYGMANGAVANGPRYFKVWTKSGQVMEFGKGPSSDANSNALVTAYGQNVAVVWAVSRISDTVGNYIDFKYNIRNVAWGSGTTAGTPTTGTEWNLVEIQYTGNSITNQVPSNKIVFDYADRPDTPGLAQDRSEGYHQGSKTVSVQLLKAIRTYINWPGPALGVTASPGGARITPAPAGAVLVKATKLTYTAGANTGRSSAVSIQECVGSAETTCMPATSFTYDPGTSTVFAPSAAFAANMGTTPLTSTDGSRGVLIGDFNGDGRSDILVWAKDPTQNKLYTSNGDGNFTLSTTFNLTGTNNQLFTTDGCYYAMVADFNGDGLPDILRYASATGSSNVPCTNPGTSVLYLNNGNGSFTTAPIVGVTLQRLISSPPNNYCGAPNTPCTTSWQAGMNFYLLDVDGDGKLDIVTSMLRQGQAPFVPNTGNGIGSPISYGTACPNSICTHVYKGDGTGHFTDITPASMQAQMIFVNPSATIGEPAHVADVNGDGLPDLVAMQNGPSTLSATTWLSNGDGSFTPMAAAALCNYPIDFNGDGHADCLTAGGSAATNTLTVASGSSTMPLVANFNLTATGQELNNVVPVDVDGDGRTDLIRWKDDYTQNVVYLSNGDGTFRTSTSFNLNTADYALQKGDGTKQFVTGDFTGHGNVEILRMVASPVSGATATTNQLFLKAAMTPPETLTQVTTGSGIAHKLTWVSIANSASGQIGPRFTQAPLPAYPLQNMTMPMWVVATVQSGTGVGGSTVNTEYAYNGLRVGLDGRGMLGFMKMIEQHVAPNNSVTRLETTYLQDRGYVGSAGVVQSYDQGIGSGGHLLSETTSAYCDTTSSAALPAITTFGTAPTPCPSTALIERPYLYQTVAEGWDIDSQRTALPVTTTTNTFDAEGNPAVIVSTTTGTVAGASQTSTKTVNNNYSGEDIAGDHWVLNHLVGATVNNVVANALPNVTTSSGTGAHAADRSGPIAGPNIPALMTIITNLLLSD